MQTTKSNSDLIIPDVKAVAIDNTRYWDDSVTDRTGRLFDIYLYDKNQRVHACSFRAMHELYWVDVYPENYIEDGDEWHEIYHAAIEQDVSYVPVSETERLEDATFPDGMFYDERTKDFGSPPKEEWRRQVEDKGRDDAHADFMRHAVQAYPENPLFA